MPSALDYTQVKLGNGFSTDPQTGSFFLNPTAVEDIARGTVDPLGAVVPARVGVMYVNTLTGRMFLAVGVTNQDWVSMGVNVLSARWLPPEIPRTGGSGADDRKSHVHSDRKRKRRGSTYLRAEHLQSRR